MRELTIDLALAGAAFTYSAMYDRWQVPPGQVPDTKETRGWLEHRTYSIICRTDVAAKAVCRILWTEGYKGRRSLRAVFVTAPFWVVAAVVTAIGFDLIAAVVVVP